MPGNNSDLPFGVANGFDTVVNQGDNDLGNLGRVNFDGGEWGVEVVVQDIETVSMGDLDEQITRSSAIIVGSPTINQNILMPIYKLFALINPLRDKGKLAGAFGSFGWSGENKQMIESNLKNLKLNIFDEGIFVKFTPDAEEEQRCIQWGIDFANAMLKQQSETAPA